MLSQENNRNAIQRPITALAESQSCQKCNNTFKVIDERAEMKDLDEKDLKERVDVYERITVMLYLQGKHQPDPKYIENVQSSSFRVIWRKKIAQWLLQFKDEFKISFSTIEGAVNLVDRYLSMVPTKKTLLQLVAMVSIFVSAKLHEPYPIPLLELQRLAEGMYTSADIKLMELNLLHVVNWDLNPITPSDYVRQVLSTGCWEFGSTSTIDKLVEKCESHLNLLMLEYSLIQYLPSEMAVAAMLVAMRQLEIDDKEIRKVCQSLGLVSSRSRENEVKLFLQDALGIEKDKEDDEDSRCDSPTTVMAIDEVAAAAK